VGISQQGATFTMTLEGFESHWYADVGGTGTIGDGFTWASRVFQRWWTTNRPGIKFGPGATMTRAEGQQVLMLLMNEEYGPAVDRRFRGCNLTQWQLDACYCDVYNAGADALGDQWAARLAAGDVAGAAELLRTNRVTSKGRRVAGLVNRRRDEAELLLYGDYAVGRLGTVVTMPPAPGLLRRGDRGSEVLALQTQLASVRAYSGALDGLFGRATEAAVLAFQRGHGLDVDGVVGPATSRVLATFAGASKQG